MAPASEATEYKFHINAFSPATMPLERLAEYLSYIARIMGEKDSVHFSHIERGSTTPVLRVDREAIPKVQDRIHMVRAGEGSSDSLTALHELNKRLAEDNANGELLDASNAKVLTFPGRDAAVYVPFGPIAQYGEFEGIPIRIGGERQNVPIHLQNGDETHIILAPRRLAIGIAKHLFDSAIRVSGDGKWIRNRLGDWVMQSFMASDFQPLRNESLSESIVRLRSVPAEWKQHEDPLQELAELRSGDAIR